MIKSSEFLYYWWLLRGYTRFVPTPVSNVAPLGASLSGGETDEDSALWQPPLPLSHLFFTHYLMKFPVWTHLKQPVESSRQTPEGFVPHLAQAWGLLPPCTTLACEYAGLTLEFWLEYSPLFLGTCSLVDDRARPFYIYWKDDWLTLLFCCPDSFLVLTLLFLKYSLSLSLSSSDSCT